MKNKGIATSIIQMLTGFLIVGMVILLYFTALGRYFDIHAFVKGNEVERHTINLAQVLLSSENLAYTDANIIHRGLLDKDKLDEQFAEADTDIKNMWYPNSIISIEVKDLESGSKWNLVYSGEITKTSGISEHLECINGIDIWDIKSCEASLESRTGTAVKQFPLTIRLSENEIHVGRMTVKLTEL